jgi:23S rRNA-/tRNA-specific pseudouridylate synthase
MTVHRLDKETSGVLIFARNKETHRALNIQFEERKIQKKYWLISHNIPEWEHFCAQMPLLMNGDRRHRTIVSHIDKPSRTDFFQHKNDHQKNLSVLQAIPHTGYTHQIRAHISFLGFPILGDSLYNKGLSKSQLQLNNLVGRMMLHATSIEFTHPDTHQQLLINAEIPFSLDDS